MDGKAYISALERHGEADYKAYKAHRVKIPLGKAGPWIVREFVTEMGLAYLRLARDGRPPGIGKFTALNHKDHGIVMSDTIPEIQDLEPYLHRLKGNILITGLGLGMVAHILTKIEYYSKNVKSLTIIEKDRNVIKLMADHYRNSDPRITIIYADAFAWVPPKGTKYDAAWHDIWGEMCEDNRPAMITLRKRYQRYVVKGQQFCWGQAILDSLRRQSGRL